MVNSHTINVMNEWSMRIEDRAISIIIIIWTVTKPVSDWYFNYTMEIYKALSHWYFVYFVNGFNFHRIF